MSGSEQTDSGDKFAEFWRDFRFFPLRIERDAFDRWYLFVLGPYVVLLTLSVIIDVSRGERWRTINVLTDWALLSVGVALAVMAILLNRWRGAIAPTFQSLLDERRIQPEAGEDDAPQKYYDFLAQYQRALVSKWRYLLIVCLMLITLAVTLTPLILDSSAWPDFLRSLRILVRNVLSLLFWTYFAAVGAWAVCVTGWHIGALTSEFQIKIQPNHPDKCGGLRPLGEFCFRMAMPILAAAVFLGIYGIAGALLGLHSPVTLAANVGLGVFVLPSAAVAFFAPLWNLHREMLWQKKRDEDDHAQRVTNLEEKIRSALDSGKLDEAKAAKDELAIRQSLRPANYPTWPFDNNVRLKFWTPQIVPVIGLFATLDSRVAEALKSIITILSGG